MIACSKTCVPESMQIMQAASCDLHTARPFQRLFRNLKLRRQERQYAVQIPSPNWALVLQSSSGGSHTAQATAEGGIRRRT